MAEALDAAENEPRPASLAGVRGASGGGVAII